MTRRALLLYGVYQRAGFGRIGHGVVRPGLAGQGVVRIGTARAVFSLFSISQEVLFRVAIATTGSGWAGYGMARRVRAINGKGYIS